MRWRVLLTLFLLGYGFLFYQQEHISRQIEPHLSSPLPSVVQKAVLGVLRQLSAEMHFIRTCVFLGNPRSDPTGETNADNLALNFQVMADLHPLFIDTYFLCQSTLAYQGGRHTRAANKVLEKGMAAMPDQWILPFFKGFNHYFYLKENRQAAEDLMLASKIPGSVSWLGHLASKLAAEEGDIENGLIWLNAILRTEEDEQMRERYKKEIAIFEKAYAVQKAIFQFHQMHAVVPPNLTDLIPDFLPGLPDFGGSNYYLEWNPPVLRLKRKAPAR